MDEETRNSGETEPLGPSAPEEASSGADDALGEAGQGASSEETEEGSQELAGDVPDEPVSPPEFRPNELWADELLEEESRRSASPTALVLREELSALLARYDKPNFVRVAVESVTAQRLTIDQLYRDVLTPLLVDVGAQWQRGHVAIWEEHLAAAMVRTVVEILYPGVLKAKGTVPPAERSVLLANPPEEHHDLGLRMIADRFDMAGWTTHFMGADAPVADLLAAARTLGVDAIVLSSATHFHRLELRSIVDRLETELDHVHVWVGGSAFAAADEGWASYEIRDIETLLAQFTPRAAPASPPPAPTEE